MANYKEYLSGHDLEVYKECILPDMAKFFYEQGDYDRAISLYEDLYSYRVIEQKNTDASTFFHMNTLITILLNEANYDRIKEVITTAFGALPEVQSIIANLAGYSRSDRWLVEYHNSVSSRLDATHSAVLYSLTGLEDALLKTPDYRFAYHLEQFKVMAGLAVVESHNEESVMAMLMECLNSLCGGVDKYQTLEDWKEQFQVANRSESGAVHSDLVNYLKYFGDFFHQRAQYETARTLLRKAIDVSNVLNESDPDFSLWKEVAECHLKEGSTALAGGVLRESVVHMEDKLGAADQQVLAALESIIKLYYSDKMYEEAELVSVDLLFRLETTGAKSTHIAEAKGKLASLYQLQHKYDFAIPLLEELVMYHKGTHGDKHADTLSSLHDLASALLHHGNLQKSKTVYEECCAGYRELLGADHASTKEAETELLEVQNAMEKLNANDPEHDGSGSPSKTQEIVRKFLSSYESTVDPKAKFSRVKNLFAKNIIRPSLSPPVSSLSVPMANLTIAEPIFSPTTPEEVVSATVQNGPETTGPESETATTAGAITFTSKKSIMQKYTKTLLKGHAKVTVTEPARVMTASASAKAVTSKSSKSAKAERAGRRSSKSFRKSTEPASAPVAASGAKDQALHEMSDAEFSKVFGMDRTAFTSLKGWKQTALRKERGYF